MLGVYLFRRLLFIALAIMMGACVSEDPNLLNPPAESANVKVRLMNMINDGQMRLLAMDRGIRTAPVPYALPSLPVGSPGDSSFLEVIGAMPEFKTTHRSVFSRNSVLTVYAVNVHGDKGGADTIMLHMASPSLSFTNEPLVRLVNMITNSVCRYSLRLGCPSGADLSGWVAGGSSSVFAKVNEGFVVFSLLENCQGIERTVSIFEASFTAWQQYSLIIHRQATGDGIVPLLLRDLDSTATSVVPTAIVNERKAYARIVNVSGLPVSGNMISPHLSLGNAISGRGAGPWTEIVTCVSDRPDAFEVRFSDELTATDSASFNVRERTSLIVFRNGEGLPGIVIAEPQKISIPAGSSLVRVVNASRGAVGVNVSTGARTDASHLTGISAGTTLARNILPGVVTSPVVIPSGYLPLSLTSVSAPTTLLSTVVTRLQSGENYLLIIHEDDEGKRQIILVADNDEDKNIDALPTAGFVRFLNGDSRQDHLAVSVGDAVKDGQVYYRSSLATAVPVGSFRVTVNGTDITSTAEESRRTLLVATEHQGDQKILEFITFPLSTIPGRTETRVINASADRDFISIAYDSMPSPDYPAQHMLERLANGTFSNPIVINSDRRGSLVFYDPDTMQQMYRIPSSLAPIGNSMSLIVTGSRQTGYYVVVLQEF